MAIDGFKHFFVPARVKTPRITVNGIGYSERMPPALIDRPNGKPDWLFMLFYDAATVRIGDHVRQIEPHSLMIWPPRRPQYYGNHDAAWRHSWIHCDGSHVRGLVKSLGLPTNTPIPHADPAVAEQHLLAIHAELHAGADPDPVIVRNLLENWLRHIRRRLDDQTTGRPQAAPQRFVELRRYLELNYTRRIRLHDLAMQSHLSVPYLCGAFKRHFGIAPIDYVIRLRLIHAAHLLPDRNLTVTQIASIVGYADLYHFSKLFKQHYGVNPTAMRSGKT